MNADERTKSRRKAAKDRNDALLLERAKIHPVLLELANLAMARGRLGWPRDPARRQELVTAMHPSVVAILKKYKLPHAGAPFGAAVPIVIMSFHAARILTDVAKAPHVKSTAFVNATDAAEHAIQLWYDRATVPLEHVDAWAKNLHAAQAWMENLRHVPREALALVRCCANNECPSRLYLLRSGRREPRFCPRPGCRQADHRRRGRVSLSIPS